MFLFKKLFIFLFVTISGITTFHQTGSLEEKLIDITVTSSFDNDTITNNVNDVSYGTTVTLDSSLGSQEGYSFSCWIVNGVLEDSFLQSHSFVVTQEMDIQGVFHSASQSVAIFRDTNGNVLDIQYVTNGGNATEPSITYPDKPGYIVSATKWDQSLTNITEDTTFTLQYEIDTSSSFDITVVNGSGGGTYSYNSTVTLTADTAPVGSSFAYWSENGQVISRNATDQFAVLSDRTIKAVYTDGTVSDAPYVSLTADLAVRTGYYSYIGRFYIPEDFSLVEWGMISNDTPDFNIDTTGIGVHQGNFRLSGTNIFMMSFDKNNYNYVKAYLILKDTAGDIVTLYSDTRGQETTVAQTDYYSTSFEDASKGAYEIGDITTQGEIWSLDDALLGSLTNDQVYGTQSVRIRVGNITTQFAVSDISEINFLYGRYLGDNASNFSLELSSDLTNWTVLDDAIYADTAFTRYTYTLDSAAYTTLGLDSNTAYYIRIASSSGERVNIDDFHIKTGVSQTSNVDLTNSMYRQTKPVTITFPETIDLYYSVGDTFTADTCYATDIVNGNVSCSVSGSVDTNTRGDFTVTYTAKSYEGITYSETKDFVVFKDDSYLDVDYTGYYDGIEGLYGNDLLLALRTIINTDLTRISYGDVRYALETVDEDPDHPGNVLLMYDHSYVTATWDGGLTWNREHVWPNSRLGVDRVDNTDINIASDLHNLRACDPSINSSRSNKYYDETTTDLSFYPGATSEGDAARILFYMAVMYPELTLGNEVLYNDTETNYLPEGAKMSMFDVLIGWNYSDPVDTFETNRNDAIYSVQNNRNPFIDYSYLVELIWYDHPNIPE